MYKYKCKSVGDCSVANRAEPIVSDSLMNEPKCSECGGDLELIKEKSGEKKSGGSSGKGLVMGGIAASVVVVAGAAWFLLGEKTAPQEALVVSMETAPIPVSAPVSAPAAVPELAPSDAKIGSGISPSESESAKARQDADEKLSSGQFSEAEKKAARAAALEMIKTAVAKMGQGDLSGAESELLQAQKRDATESLIYYNLAIVRLRQQQPDEALKQLEAAFMAGFTHFDAMDKDSDINPLRNQPKFKELMGIYRKAS